MTCKNAIVGKPVVAHKGQTVKEVIELIEEKHVRTVPVVDENNVVLGTFGFSTLMKSLLPVSATMEDGLQSLDFIIGAGPGIAKRLRKLYPQNVEDVVDHECKIVQPDTPAWEAVRMIVKYGSPIPVVNEKDGTLVGILSEKSLLGEFRKIIDELEAEGVFERKEAEDKQA